MKFLLDQDVYAATAAYLRSLGHDVMRASDIGLATASDETLLRAAHEMDRIFVTRDRDFGSLVFVHSAGTGVIYLRVLPSRQDEVHNQLNRVLLTYSEAGLKSAFTVIERNGHRYRRVIKPTATNEDES